LQSREGDFDAGNQTKACQEEVKRFLKEIMLQRSCWQREIEKSALEANAPVDRLAGFVLCVPPTPPACVNADEPFRSDAGVKACQEDVARFVNNVFAYRACLQREIARSVLETNKMLDLAKCGWASKHRCQEGDLKKLKK